jgi:hypothetical protein
LKCHWTIWLSALGTIIELTSLIRTARAEIAGSAASVGYTIYLRYIEVARTGANEQSKALAHCPVVAILGNRQKENSVDQETIT